jgi:hypothetical protein
LSTTSNLYAEKVFAEHPSALWSLDEPADYVSLVSHSDRDLSANWITKDSSGQVLTNGVTSYLDPASFPGRFPIEQFSGEYVNQINLPTIVVGETDSVTITSTEIIQLEDLDLSLETFSISTYVFPFGQKIEIDLGYEYTDSVTLQASRETKTFYIAEVQQWGFIAETFDIPANVSDIKVYFKITYTQLTETTPKYTPLLHALTFGQWSESFHVESLGSVPQNISTDEEFSIAIDYAGNMKGVVANAYGLQSKNGYYLINDRNSLSATNSGMPLVYGASSSTRVVPNKVYSTSTHLPGVIVPGFGFLNQEGQYSDLTVELWMRIQSSAIEPRRIFGPTNSLDGIYVNDSFMILKVNENIGSYYIGEWDRPMIVSVRMGKDSASLTINGEEVVKLSYITSSLSLPSRYTEIDSETYNQDWLGVYAYEDVPVIEIDSVGIYPYLVPNVVEKRRWVYGQGVETPENIKGFNLGASVSIDYPVANYAKNYLYPDMGRWAQGINENLTITNSTISMPEYELPEIKFSNKKYEEWFSSVSSSDGIYGTYTTLKPNELWNNTEGYILFENLNFIQQDLKAFYILLESDPNNASVQTLFCLEHKTTGDKIVATLSNGELSYSMSYLTASGATIQEDLVDPNYVTGHTAGDFIIVGLDMQKFSSFFGGRVTTMLGSKQQLRLYVAGQASFDSTFYGKIYRIGFCTARNLSKISTIFTNDSGLVVGYNSLESEDSSDGGDFSNQQESDYWERTFDAGDANFGNLNDPYEDIADGGGVYAILVDKILSHIASYTFIPKTFLGKYVLDIASNGYWQDYVPLSYFSKYVYGGQNKKVNDLDFLQFNISYPQINKFFMGKYDTSNSVVRTFISFQELQTTKNAIIRPDYFLNTELPPRSGVISPTENAWRTTRYEVTNGMVIYPPQNVNFKAIAIVLHIEILSNGKIENPVKIQSLQLASQALNAYTVNPIGTKFGTDIYPYVKTGEYYDYKKKNPFSITKGSSPYLYMTSTSGIRLRDFTDHEFERGINIPINPSSSATYKTYAWQMSARFDDEKFPSFADQAFEIEGATEKYKFFLVADSASGKRGIIYAINANTGLPANNIVFFINGQKVKNPRIQLGSWTTIGIGFSSPLDFANFIGSFRITGSVIFDNISHYQTSASEQQANSVYRKWSGVSAVDGGEKTWDYWKTLQAFVDGDDGPTRDFTWRDVLFVSSKTFAGIDGKAIYKKYTGNDRFVVDTGSTFRLHNYQYQFYKSVSWSAITTTPV